MSRRCGHFILFSFQFPCLLQMVSFGHFLKVLRLYSSSGSNSFEGRFTCGMIESVHILLPFLNYPAVLLAIPSDVKGTNLIIFDMYTIS